MNVRDSNGVFALRDLSPRVVKEIKASAIVSYHITPTESGTHDLIFLAEGSNLGPLEGTLTTTINEPVDIVWTWSIVGGLYLTLGVILYTGVRQSVEGTRNLMLYIKAWSTFAWQNPALATVFASIPFIVLALLINIYDSVIYSNGTPGAMLAAITVLYLILTAMAGFISPLRVGSIGPVLAYDVITLLWPLVPGGNTYEAMTYDSGWPGVVVTIAVASAVIWLSAFAGNLIGGATRSDK